MALCWHCGTTLPPPKRAAGRQRRYCSGACRQAACRDARRARAVPLADDLDAAQLAQLEQVMALMFVADTDPVQAAVEVVLALRGLAGRARRLAAKGPANLRWRHASTAAALEKLLDTVWPVP